MCEGCLVVVESGVVVMAVGKRDGDLTVAETSPNEHSLEVLERPVKIKDVVVVPHECGGSGVAEQPEVGATVLGEERVMRLERGLKLTEGKPRTLISAWRGLTPRDGEYPERTEGVRKMLGEVKEE